ncbi:MAG: hypothetical protein NZ529_07775, partial [Cytophagaceae bacterium]|nr:hypothetical protein [Cytophagaceae bacterium]MDW8456684.1 hypothetical protein [Cytophagaceae bacterium]
SHGLQGQCGALAKHRSDSGVADSPAPQGRALHAKIFHHTFPLKCVSQVECIQRTNLILCDGKNLGPGK